MKTTDLQDLVAEKNAEMREFIKESMRVNKLSRLPIDERELMVDTPTISAKQMIDVYYSTIQHVTARLIELEGKNEIWKKRRDIIAKKVEKKEKECMQRCRKSEREARKHERAAEKIRKSIMNTIKYPKKNETLYNSQPF